MSLLNSALENLLENLRIITGVEAITETEPSNPNGTPTQIKSCNYYGQNFAIVDEVVGKDENKSWVNMGMPPDDIGWNLSNIYGGYSIGNGLPDDYKAGEQNQYGIYYEDMPRIIFNENKPECLPGPDEYGANQHDLNWLVLNNQSSNIDANQLYEMLAANNAVKQIKNEEGEQAYPNGIPVISTQNLTIVSDS